jgi:hypothetical protein
MVAADGLAVLQGDTKIDSGQEVNVMVLRELKG